MTTVNNQDAVKSIKDSGEKPKFGSRLKFSSLEFDFQRELDRLPFPLNLGKVEMSKEQQVRFLELIYDNQSVFLLCDEDLGLCDCLKHTIPTTMDKPIYLPHHTIPVQLQAEVCKCLDTWLRQGIIQPSWSPYALQVVIVCKKTGEIQLCIDFCALNAITVCESFPLPRIEGSTARLQFGSPHLILLRDICSWQWMRQTFIKLLSMWVLRDCMSSLICTLDFQMLELVFVTLWKCAWVTNST